MAASDPSHSVQSGAPRAESLTEPRPPGSGPRTAENPAELIRRHEALLFQRAYPKSAAEARQAAEELATFARRIPSDHAAFQEPEVSGIAGTSLTAVFSYEVARRLAARYPKLRIDWEAYDHPEKLGPVLRRFIPLINEDWPVEAHAPFQRWMEEGKHDLRWLLDRIAQSGLSERDAADLYESLELPLYWEMEDGPHTRSRLCVPSGPLHYLTQPLIRRKDVSLVAALQAPPLPVARVSKRDTARILDVILDTSAMRYRELYGFSHPDAANVYRADAGRGLAIYFFGVPDEWRLPLRTYLCGMFFQNGVPAGYVEVLSLFERAEIGYNLYYTFREGESAWIYAQLLRLCHQTLGVNTFVVDPYQIGHENPEAIESGAFWFYRKLGFRPTDPEVARVLRREERRIEREPKYRSSARALKKLSAGPMIFEGPGAEVGAWDGFQVRNIGYAVERGEVSSALLRTADRAELLRLGKISAPPANTSSESAARRSRRR